MPPAIRIATALLCLTAACGDGGASTALAGIYQRAGRTYNPDGCDAEGPPQLVFDENFFVRLDSFLGVEFISVVSCDDLEACRVTAADTDTIHLGEFTLDSGNDEDGWIGRSFETTEAGVCTGLVRESVLTGEAGQSVRIDQEIRTVSDVPVDDMGECDEEAAYAQAEDLPCEQLVVVKGNFVEGI